MYVWMNKSYGTCHENPVECSPLTSINLHHQTSLTCNNMQESSFFIGRSLIQTSHGRTVCEANVLENGAVVNYWKFVDDLIHTINFAVS